MTGKSILWIVLAIGALIVFIPVAIFVFTHLKEGYQDAERERANRPPAATAPAPTANPTQDNTATSPRGLAEIDFNKLDFSRHTTDYNSPTTQSADSFPRASGSGNNSFRTGAVGQGRFEVRGGIDLQTGASWVRLPSSPHSGGVCVVEVAVEHGTVRVYLQGLTGHFVGGSIFAEASPGQPARVIGYLQDQSDSGTPEQNFLLEAREGEARGISYRVYRKE